MSVGMVEISGDVTNAGQQRTTREDRATQLLILQCLSHPRHSYNSAQLMGTLNHGRDQLQNKSVKKKGIFF